MVSNQGLRFLGFALIANLIVFASITEGKSVANEVNELPHLGLLTVLNSAQPSESSNTQVQNLDVSIRKVLIGLFVHFLNKKDYARALEMQALLDDLAKRNEESGEQPEVEKRATKRRTFFVGK
jgi:hypothetical protein